MHRSLMYQGDLHLEIVLVDDGSTDLSRKIADEYAKKEDRIKVIHQENEGASAARNPGLEIAQGEYIAFLDSEDWISWKDKAWVSWHLESEKDDLGINDPESKRTNSIPLIKLNPIR